MELILAKKGKNIFCDDEFARSRDDAIKFEFTPLDVDIKTKMVMRIEPHVPTTFSSAVTATSFEEPTSSMVKL